MFLISLKPSIFSASINANNTNVTVAYNDIKRVIDNAKQGVLNISEWMRINKLYYSTKKRQQFLYSKKKRQHYRFSCCTKVQKTESMVRGYPLKSRQSSLPESFMPNNRSIKRATQTKCLGLIVDENFSCETQFNRIMKLMLGFGRK